MSYFSVALDNLNKIGLSDVILPFLLVFTVIYAILIKTKILGEYKKNRNFAIAVAFVVALLVIIDGHVVSIINKAIPNVGVVVIAILMFLILIGLMGGDVKWMGNSVSGWIALVSFVVIIYIFGAAAGWWGDTSSPWMRWMNDPTTVATVIVLLVFGILIWFITSDPDNSKTEDTFMDKLGKLFENKKL